MNEQNNQNLHEVTTPSGRKMLLQKLPKQFYIFYGNLPTNLSNKALAALQGGDKDVFAAEVAKTISAEEAKNTLVMMREAVKHVCVKPKLSLEPKGADEISPLDLAEGDFEFLSAWAFQSSGNLGGLAAGLESFRH